MTDAVLAVPPFVEGFTTHKGVTIFRTFKYDDPAQGVLAYQYSTSRSVLNWRYQFDVRHIVFRPDELRVISPSAPMEDRVQAYYHMMPRRRTNEQDVIRRIIHHAIEVGILKQDTEMNNHVDRSRAT